MVKSNREAAELRVKSRSKQKVEREKDMTVCIAAIYKSEISNVDGMGFATDWQETDSNTDMKSQGAWKIRYINQNIVALGADDMILFHDLVGRVDDKIAKGLSSPLTVRRAAELYVEAEADFKREYLERHVLANMGTSWDKFETKLANDELPQSYVDYVQEALYAVTIPYATETIFAGLESSPIGPFIHGRIFKITPKTGIEDYTEKGYAIIGSGDLIADAEFKQGFYNRFLSKHMVLSYCLMAKKRSEVIASVGDKTGLWLLEHGSSLDSVNFDIRIKLERDYERLKKQRQLNDYKTCDRSERYFEEFPHSTREAKRQDNPSTDK